MKRLITIVLLLAVCLSVGGCGSGNEPAPTAPETTAAQALPNPTGTILRDDTQTPDLTQTNPDTDKPELQETRLTFAACGDNIVYYGNVREAAQIDGTYDFRYSYDQIRQTIRDADISFINQENIMAKSLPLSYYPCFNVPQEVGEAVLDTGFDIVNLANNHMLDKGEKGLREAVDFWRESGAFIIGDYLSEDEYNALRIYEKDGVSIAFLSYTYGTNGIYLASSSDIVIPYLDEADITRQVKAARQAADLVFVSVHWGEENLFRPTEEQTRYAALFADLGVDAIIGHHPHVIQPIEWIEGKDGHRTLCVYSLGNLMAEMACDYNMVGGILTFDIVKTAQDSHIENVLFTPTVFYFTRNFYQNIVYFMEDFTAEMAASHGISYYGNSTTVEKLRAYVTKTIGREFLPSYLF